MPGVSSSAGFADLPKLFSGRERQVLPTAARSVLEAGPDKAALQQALEAHQAPSRVFREGA